MTILVRGTQLSDHCSFTFSPSPWVLRFLPGVRAGGTLLDVACGSGRHLDAAANSGLAATGIDRDISQAVALGLDRRAALVAADLERDCWPASLPGPFDAVVVTNYLWRPLLPTIVKIVAPDGLLIYETFAEGNATYGRPSNPDFLLKPGELLDAIAGRLMPLAFEQVRLSAPDRVVQRICAAGPAHPWVRDGAPTG